PMTAEPEAAPRMNWGQRFVNEEERRKYERIAGGVPADRYSSMQTGLSDAESKADPASTSYPYYSTRGPRDFLLREKEVHWRFTNGVTGGIDQKQPLYKVTELSRPAHAGSAPKKENTELSSLERSGFG